MKSVYFSPLKTKKNNVREGGASRDILVNKFYINKFNPQRVFEDSSLLNFFNFFKTLLLKNNYIILLHYPSIGFPLFTDGKFKLISIIVQHVTIWLIGFSSKKNKIIIDIADLKFEQFQAMNKYHKIHKILEVFENKLFRKKVIFIFSSSSMKSYAEKKYSINPKKSLLLNNSSPKLNTKVYFEATNHVNFLQNKIYFVYAGSLNKGRQIEDLIRNFPNLPDRILILLGAEGEWIRKINLNENVIHVEGLEEKYAHLLVSKCDIGLIPYSEKNEYYNLCYPVKLPFYLSAGISFLSTPTLEAVRLNEVINTGFVLEIEIWDSFIRNVKKETILELKNEISSIKHKFSHEYEINHFNLKNNNLDELSL
jgi:glycosyltransferase involved in cell wall biosynthesis